MVMAVGAWMGDGGGRGENENIIGNDGCWPRKRWKQKRRGIRTKRNAIGDCIREMVSLLFVNMTV